MATHVCTGRSTHQTITLGGTAETITLDKDYETVEVANWDSTAKIYFRFDGVAATVAGDGTYVIGPGDALLVHAGPDLGTADAVSVICATTGVAYTVTGE